MLTLARARQNYLLQSEALSASPWTAFNVSVSTDASARSPDGDLGAEVLTSSTAGDAYVNQQVGTSLAILYSVFVKKGGSQEADFVTLRPITFGTAVSDDALIFQFSSKSFSGAIGSQFSSFGYVACVDDWFRIWALKAAQPGQTTGEIRIRPGLSAGDTCYAWGAQMEVDVSSLGPYQVTSSSNVTTTPDFIDLDPINYERKDDLVQNIHRMKSGAGFRYVWGSQAKAKFKAETTSATATTVNSWWAAGSVVVMQQSNDPSLVMSSYIANKASPFSTTRLGSPDLVKGVIELEAF